MIKNNIKKLVLTSCIIGVFFVCNSCTSSFDEINTNPDATTKVTSAMLATKVILNNVQSSNSSNSEYFCKRIFWGEQINEYQYNRIQNGSFDEIRELTNAQRILDFSSDANRDAYTGLYYYLKGWAFFRATMDMGDIPYSEALQVDKYKNPKYDEQKDVFKGILNDLEQADGYFAKAKEGISGDPFYNGDPVKWRKSTNVLRLKVLMALQKREEDTPDLQIKESFAKIVQEGCLFESNSDNLQISYSNKDGQKNPLHQDLTRSINVYAGTKTIIDPLKKYKDYRLFSYFSPVQALTDSLFLPDGETLLSKDDWNAYQGLDASGIFNIELQKISNRMHCRPNEIYRTDYVGVPSIRLGYADMNFVLAEAAERGWIKASAQTYYEEGIRASFEFVRSTVSSTYNQGRIITDEYIEQYLKGDGVAYDISGSSLDRLKQIWMQKYIASYFHLSWDSFYEYRRTGYPEWPINPQTNLNDNKDKIPVRWLYPESETNYNKEKLNEAVSRQWNGSENINKIIWVIK